MRFWLPRLRQECVRALHVRPRARELSREGEAMAAAILSATAARDEAVPTSQYLFRRCTLHVAVLPLVRYYVIACMAALRRIAVGGFFRMLCLLCLLPGSNDGHEMT